MEHIYIALPYQSSFCISTNVKELCENIYRFYGHYVNKEQVKTSEHIIIFKVNEEYVIETINNRFLTKHPLLSLDRYIFQHSTYDEQVYPLHGAAIEWKGKCNILLASTGGGKTTLAGYLVSQGFGYLSDDRILVDKQKFLVYPCTVPMHLRKGGMRILQEYGVVLNDINKLVEAPFFERYIYSPHNYIKKPLVLQGVYFLERNEKNNSVIDMDKSDSITRLLRSPSTPDIVDAEYFRFISVLNKFKCKRLLYSDMEFVKTTIKNS